MIFKTYLFHLLAALRAFYFLLASVSLYVARFACCFIVSVLVNLTRMAVPREAIFTTEILTATLA
jgi:hypothetical protein